MTSTRTIPRVDWSELTTEFQAAIEAELGASVVEWSSQEEGFSPGLAARCVLSDGRKRFIKALPEQLLEISGRFQRHEVAVMSSLPTGAPAPAMLGVVDESFGLAAVFEDVDGATPTLPWERHELQAVIDTIDSMTLAPVAELGDLTRRFNKNFTGWRRLAAEEATDIEPWIDQSVLNRLAQLEAPWAEHCPPTALIHSDIRADNILLSEDQVFIVDWANACNGPPWADLLFMIPSVAMSGGWDAADVWAMSRFSDTVDPEAITAVAAAGAGFFTASARLPPIPSIPMLRDFQEAQARPARAWVRQRLGL